MIQQIGHFLQVQARGFCLFQTKSSGSFTQAFKGDASAPLFCNYDRSNAKLDKAGISG